MKSGKNLRVLTDSNLQLSVVRNSQNLKSPYLTQPEVSVDLADSQSAGRNCVIGESNLYSTTTY